MPIGLYPLGRRFSSSCALSLPTVAVRPKIPVGILVPVMRTEACAPVLTNLQPVPVLGFLKNRPCADVGLSAFGWIRQAGNSCRFCHCTFVSICECTLATTYSILRRITQYKS